jgi:hypothetical protein
MSEKPENDAVYWYGSRYTWNGNGSGRPDAPQWHELPVTKVTAIKASFSNMRVFSNRGRLTKAGVTPKDSWVYLSDLENHGCGAIDNKKVRWLHGKSQFVFAKNGGCEYDAYERLWQSRRSARADAFEWDFDQLFGDAYRLLVGPDAALLGLSGEFTRADVRRAFKAKAKLMHPDQGGDTIAFQELVGARDRVLAAVK